MTGIKPYTFLMNTYYYKNLLLASPIVGFVWIALLFGFCFLSVHILKLARIGWQAPKSQAPQPQEKEEKKEEKKTPAPQEPIYYIVERKTRRAKSSYTEPKEIRFK